MSSSTDDPKAEWVERVLGFRVQRSSPATGLAGWQAARGQAVASLKALEDAVRRGGDPDADSAVILLRAIRANLTEAPTTSRQVDELDRYLSSDDIVEAAETPNTYGVRVDIRAPLLKALAGLRVGAA